MEMNLCLTTATDVYSAGHETQIVLYERHYFLKCVSLYLKARTWSHTDTVQYRVVSRLFLDKGVDVRRYLCFSVKGHKQARAYNPQRHGVLLYRVTHKGFLIVFRMSRWARSKGEACTSSPRRHSLFLLGVTFVRLLRKPNRIGRLSLLQLFLL